MNPMNDEWIVVRNCFLLEEALVVKSVLEADGVEVLIPDEHTLGAQPFYTNALGGARVMVRSTDFDRARAVLEAFGAAEAESENFEDDEAS